MATFDQLCTTPPAAGAGEVVDDTGTVRLVVEVAWPVGAGTPSLWDRALWDRALWGGAGVWVDVTCWVLGFVTATGRESPLGPFRVGTLDLVLDNHDGRWSSWATTGPWTVGGVSLLGAGTLLRVSLTIGGVWWPIWTGTAESWNDEADEVHRYTVRVGGVDPLADMGSDTVPDGRPAVGAGDTVDTRLARIADDAGWRWPRHLDPSPATCDPTTMAGNRLVLLQRSARADAGPVFAERDGTLRFIQYAACWPDPAAPAATLDDCDVSSRDLRDDTNRLVNDATYRRAASGSADHRATDPASLARYGPFTETASDYVCATEAQVTTLVQRRIAERGGDARRVDGLGLVVGPGTSSARQGRLWPAIAALSRLRAPLRLTLDRPALTADLLVDRVTHDVRVVGPGRVEWSATLRTVKNRPAPP